MATYFANIPAAKRSTIDEGTLGAIGAMLAANGITVEWSTIITDGDVPLSIILEASADPTALIAAWFSTATDRDAQARAIVKQTVQAILAKDPGTRTAMDRFILAISWLTLREGG
jgi:hypothetical protein